MEKRWLILALLFVARIGLGFQFQTIGSVSSELVEELGLNYTEIGSLIGLFMVPGMVLAIPAGFAGRFLSDRFIVGLGLLVLGAGGGLAALADSFELLAAGRLICGVGFVLSTIFFTKIVADWFAGKELATAMAALVMSWPFGIAMGQIGHGWLAVNYDWRLALAVASTYCVVSGLLVMLFCREAPDAVRPTGGLVYRAGDLYEARELGESDLELAAMLAAEISGIPMDLLLVSWAKKVAAREQQNRKHEGAS